MKGTLQGKLDKKKGSSINGKETKTEKQKIIIEDMVNPPGKQKVENCV